MIKSIRSGVVTSTVGFNLSISSLIPCNFAPAEVLIAFGELVVDADPA